jgi:hypothetical protein
VARHLRGQAVWRQTTTKSIQAGAIVMMNGRIVSLFEWDRPSKNMNTITDDTHSTATHAANATLRARM